MIKAMAITFVGFSALLSNFALASNLDCTLFVGDNGAGLTKTVKLSASQNTLMNLKWKTDQSTTPQFPNENFELATEVAPNGDIARVEVLLYGENLGDGSTILIAAATFEGDNTEQVTKFGKAMLTVPKHPKARGYCSVSN